MLQGTAIEVLKFDWSGFDRRASLRWLPGPPSPLRRLTGTLQFPVVSTTRNLALPLIIRS